MAKTERLSRNIKVDLAKQFNFYRQQLVSALLFLTSVCLSTTINAQETDIEYYQNDNVTNQIPYFDNRFRIDAQVEELTLLFYRESGTPPVILVQPDGTKLKVNFAKEMGIEWYDDRTFDMIKLKNPMPGPWQAIGSVLPHSRIMVLSEVTLNVEPLPTVLLQGETIKVTGSLLNGDRAIDNPDFREVITLDVDFFSTNNSAFDNFGAEPIKLASFRDDGYELDEVAGDSIYTGEFELDFSPGEWLPIYRVKMPMANRDLQQTPIVIRPTPITLSVELAEDVGQQHMIIFTIDPSYVDPDSIILQGKVSFPDRQVEPFSVMEGKGESREYAIPFTEGGVHRVKVSAFGRTTEGREFRLVVAEFSFNVDHSDEQLENMADSQENDFEQQQKAEQAELEAQAFAQEQARLIEEVDAEQQTTYILIAIGNVIVIILAAAIFFISTRRKKKK